MTEAEDAGCEVSSVPQMDLRLVKTSTEDYSHTVHQLAARDGYKYVLRIPNNEFAALMANRETRF
ncbi:hypothetical protein ACRE_025950 [Hapsidospora chrysogenum ATCC 11550]|uniref:Uncharacterized protein n=1 Tax=Hapsidospora chrysogenum (strain ATCC 11550 / CBS 779.69 / DSM 880 / IAM 14645 / JCM 23072 / IMI 49137) TaxID=857340 RepID=A0A086TB30_HAPC1|nr:hypothetical protein ACRE_025950 [Hapsidospora chrysogenum ATCC 11550]